jgi:hypothetical protein
VNRNQEQDLISMSELKHQVEQLIKEWGNDLPALAAKIHKTKAYSNLVVYLIHNGLVRIATKMRKSTRNQIKKDLIDPEFIQHGEDKPKPKLKIKVEASERTKQRLLSGIFLEWKIGSTQLGDATKEELVSAAYAERKSANGHIINAMWYEHLAQPMHDGERVAHHWKEKAAMLLRTDLLRQAENKRAGFSEGDIQPGA